MLIVISCFLYQAVCNLKHSLCQVPRACLCLCTCSCVCMWVCVCVWLFVYIGVNWHHTSCAPVFSVCLCTYVCVCILYYHWQSDECTLTEPLVKLLPNFLTFFSLSPSLLYHSFISSFSWNELQNYNLFLFLFHCNTLSPSSTMLCPTSFLIPPSFFNLFWPHSYVSFFPSLHFTYPLSYSSSLSTLSLFGSVSHSLTLCLIHFIPYSNHHHLPLHTLHFQCLSFPFFVFLLPSILSSSFHIPLSCFLFLCLMLCLSLSLLPLEMEGLWRWECLLLGTGPVCDPLVKKSQCPQLERAASPG